MTVLEALDALRAKASPTPWTLEVSEPSPYGDGYGHRVGTIYDANGQHICHFAGGAGKEADFRVIVLAVNHQRAQVAALEGIRGLGDWDRVHSDEPVEIAEKALAALQRAIEEA